MRSFDRAITLKSPVVFTTHPGELDTQWNHSKAVATYTLTSARISGKHQDGFARKAEIVLEGQAAWSMPAYRCPYTFQNLAPTSGVSPARISVSVNDGEVSAIYVSEEHKLTLTTAAEIGLLQILREALAERKLALPLSRADRIAVAHERAKALASSENNPRVWAKDQTVRVYINWKRGFSGPTYFEVGPDGSVHPA